MTHGLTITLGDAADLAWAQRTVTTSHYLRSPVDPRARPMAYIIRHEGVPMGLVMLGIPHAARCRGWWGYPDTITQWQCVDLNRIYIHPYYQRSETGIYAKPGIVPGYVDRHGVFRPTVATWAISEVLASVQADRVRLWPPVYPEQPYHIRLALSYSDPKHHKGTIYKQSGAQPMYTDRSGQPAPGPSGKYGWAWPLPEPDWTWQDLTGVRSRTLRMF